MKNKKLLIQSILILLESWGIFWIYNEVRNYMKNDLIKFAYDDSNLVKDVITMTTIFNAIDLIVLISCAVANIYLIQITIKHYHKE